MVKALLKLYLLLCLCCVSFSVNAQVVNVDLVTFEDAPVTHSFFSANTPAISLNATFGTISVTEGLPLQYEFTYTPNPGFQGTDAARLFFFPIELPNTLALMVFDIEVVPVDLDANHDLISTVAGTSVTIPVLDNDYSSTGILNLISVPAINCGTAEVVGDNIVFTPAPDYMGLADFNYVVCATNDEYEFCGTGTVSVNVLSNIAVVAADTTEVFAKRYSMSNQGAMLLVPDNYNLVTTPLNGTIEVVNGIPRYKPNQGHLGIEYLTYTNGSDDLVLKVETLDFTFNDFSYNDEASTVPDQSVTLNVVLNDLYGGFTDCITFHPPQFGTVIPGNTTGEVTYIPPPGWTGGIDRFTYTSFPPGCDPGTGETSTVTIIVSDFRPSDIYYSLTTSANANLPFTYQDPNENIIWTVVTPPEIGEIVQATNGELIYVPGGVGVDFVTVTFCLDDGNGGCVTSQNIEVEISVLDVDPGTSNCNNDGDCVWPGDTNRDGVVDIADLLPIGYYMGSAGTPRASAAPESWAPQYSEDWSKIDNGVNRKHVDANGDQFVTAQDTQVVRANLGMVNSISPLELPLASFDFILEGEIFAEPGDIVELDVFLGSSLIGVEDLAGFIFPFVYDPGIFDPSSVHFDFDDESWFSYDSPTLGLSINDTVVGDYQFGLTRTSGMPASGHGRIGKLYIGVEDLAGFRPAQGDDQPTITPVVIGDATGEAMNNNGTRRGVSVRPFELNIINYPEPVDPIDGDIDAFLEDKLQTYPNPTSEKLTVHLNGRREFTDLTILDMTGRIIESYGGLSTNHRVIDLRNYDNGIYTLQVTTDEGVVTRKIQVFH